jgi:hypothetical protein
MREKAEGRTTWKETGPTTASKKNNLKKEKRKEGYLRLAWWAARVAVTMVVGATWEGEKK